MNVGVVGAGPAGLTAAYLLKLSGHHPVVFESDDTVGGRTKTIHLGPGHHFDSGAGWISNTHRETLGFCSSVGIADELTPVDVRNHVHISRSGTLLKIAGGFAFQSGTSGHKLPLRERIRLAAWLAGLRVREHLYPGAGNLHLDEVRAESHIVECIGEYAVSAIFEPMAATACFTLSQLSAAAVRVLARDYFSGRFYSLAHGMDSLWKRVATHLEVEVAKPVRRIVARERSGVELVFDSGTAMYFDGCVVAAPITRVKEILDGIELPPWAYSVRYAPCVRVYGVRIGSARRADVYPAGLADEQVSVSRSGGEWLFGPVPRGHSAAVVSAVGRLAADLLDEPDEKVEKLLWERGAAIDPELFGIDCCYSVEVVRWPEAMPVFGLGHLKNLASWKQAPPVVFAGDWTSSPSIEGAIRSGIEAASQFGKATT